MSPTSRLLWLMVGGLFVAAIPIVVAPAMWIVVVAWWFCIALAMAIDGACLLPIVTMRVDAPESVGVGDVCTVRVAMETASRLALASALRLEVDLPLEATGQGSIEFKGATGVTEFELSAEHRGEGGVTAVWLSRRGPLGLMARVTRTPIESCRVRVVPNAARAAEQAILALGGTVWLGGVKHDRRPGAGSEYDALVPYAPGMDLRNVDWKSSARHHALRVRRFRHEKNQRIVLSLDKGRLMADPIHRLERLDHAVHASLALAYAAIGAGDLVGMHAYALRPDVYVPPAGGRKHLDVMRHAMAALRTEDVETNHFLGLRDLLTQLRRRSLVIIFTEFTDPTMAELMVESLERLALRHRLVFVALQDPLLAEPLGLRPQAVEDLARTIVAGDLRSERRRMLQRLRRAGVEIVSAPPERAGVDLVTRYLAIKREGAWA